MRKLRMILTMVLLVASCGIFGGYKIYFEKMQDVTPPVLTVPEETLTVSIHATEEEMIAGITAQDNRDGDLSENVFVESIAKFNEDMTRTVTYAVTDAAGNIAKGSRNIQYSDYVSPKFSMSGPLYFYAGYEQITESVGASDVMDGDISSKVKLSQTYQMQEKGGEYPMEFYVTNSMGDISRFTATVTLYESLVDLYAPSIRLKEYLVYADTSHQIDPLDYLDAIVINNYAYTNNGALLVPESEESLRSTMPDSIELSSVRVDNNINYSIPGCYEILYRYTWNDYTGSVRLVVIVE